MDTLGLRDRGLFLIFAPITAAEFIWLAVSRLSYTTLLLGMLLAMMSFRLVTAGYQGLIALIGQERLMSGRLSTLWSVLLWVPAIVGACTSGYISEHLAPSRTFLIVAVLALLIACLGFWRPCSVFSHTYENPQAINSNFFIDIKRLVKHRAIYPAVLILFLWNFSPGANTPLQFYLTNQLHVSDSVYAFYTGIYQASFIPTFLLYGFLCTKVSLNNMLKWGTIIGVPQMLPLAFIHSGDAALIIAVPMGLMGGVATAAYFDLAMRSCPTGLQGTLMMMGWGVFTLSYRVGDVLGSRIYASNPMNGFFFCVTLTTLVYTLIFPLIYLVPKALIATADGEPNPEIETEVLAEVERSESV